ncbi:hypothetical protein H9651_13470 [Microbacterium sp. Sa4CUA7]|uniref:Uncharacterized protein n=1 Tax=Microbacterium pullorum TaxID=2762236 RepID=A0ABR8S6E3_9MICO|nr:hypothetical protein [Microbacterium pullorum]MBD7958649.1 hypothetical protein [Microbacterium pullorum]
MATSPTDAAMSPPEMSNPAPRFVMITNVARRSGIRGSKKSLPFGRFGAIGTLVTAQRELTDVLHTIGIDEQAKAYSNREYLAEHAGWRDALVAAIAHKRAMSEEAVLAEFTAKVQKKVDKTRREWDR